MGQFSWFTNDSKRRIRTGEIMPVYLCDNKGNKWRENCYDGYGVFGGKDYYELLAEMNGFSGEDKEAVRQKGIELAFRNSPMGNNPEIIHPSLSENGQYFNGVPPIADPDQGFPIDVLVTLVPAHLVKTGMDVIISVNETSSIENLPELETVKLDKDNISHRYTAMTDGKFGNLILHDHTNDNDFPFTGKVLVQSELVIHSYMGNTVEQGDLVVCNDCCSSLLVPVGSGFCPYCHTEGYLDYFNQSDHIYATEKDLISEGKYIVVSHGRPTNNVSHKSTTENNRFVFLVIWHDNETPNTSFDISYTNEKDAIQAIMDDISETLNLHNIPKEKAESILRECADSLEENDCYYVNDSKGTVYEIFKVKYHCLEL